MVRERVSPAVRQSLLGHLVSDDLAESLDRHYVQEAAGDHDGARRAEELVDRALASMARVRRRAQALGALALAPFVGLLVLHGIPLFLASFAALPWRRSELSGFRTCAPWRGAMPGGNTPSTTSCFPLFLSVTLLSNAGFFARWQDLIRHGSETVGLPHVAFAQFLGCTVLSALLDHNVVADFASHGLHNLQTAALHIFAIFSPCRRSPATPSADAGPTSDWRNRWWPTVPSSLTSTPASRARAVDQGNDPGRR
jgi:hypothetical protein